MQTIAAAMENITNVKLYDLITRWIEVQKLRPDYCDGNPLKVDVMDLTLLLKSMGLKLDYIDFEHEKLNADTLTVQIACNKSGVLAKLSYDLVSCSCPDKNDKETSFWEVQGTGPSVFSKFRNDTSSNLLPEISEKCSMVSKAMLSNLLDYYRTNIKSIERGEDVLQSPLKVATPTICVTSPGLTNHCTSPKEEKPVEHAEPVSIPDSQRVKTDPDGSIIKPRSLEELHDSPTKTASEKSEIKSNTSSESVGIDNATRDLSGHETVGKPIIAESTLPNLTYPDENSFVNSNAMKALITSSPNEKMFDSILNAEVIHERDLNVLHCLYQARQQIDAALLVMKFNNPYMDISKATTVTTTPQTVIRSKGPISKITERNGTLARRMSLPGRPSDSPKPSAINTPGVIAKKKSTIPSQLAKTRGDTPYPNTSNHKTVSTLRKASSSSSVASAGSVTKSSTGASTTSFRKPIGITKPVGNVRPTATLPTKKTSTIGRAASTTRLDKK